MQMELVIALRDLREAAAAFQHATMLENARQMGCVSVRISADATMVTHCLIVLQKSNVLLLEIAAEMESVYLLLGARAMMDMLVRLAFILCARAAAQGKENARMHIFASAILDGQDKTVVSHHVKRLTIVQVDIIIIGNQIFCYFL